MFIKICGVTTVSDALLAAQLGATHIGLNFYPRSLRALSSVQAWEISSALHTLSTPPILVGVFVNESVPIVRHILQTYQLDLAQLSGDEPDEDLFELGSVAFKVYRPSIGQTLLPARTRTNPALLLDAPKHGDHYGGSGKITDWAWASTLARQYPAFLGGWPNRSQCCHRYPTSAPVGHRCGIWGRKHAGCQVGSKNAGVY
jgi:phosphoribosylanthranilate isomerase